MQLFPIAVNQLDGNLMNLGVGYRGQLEPSAILDNDRA